MREGGKLGTRDEKNLPGHKGPPSPGPGPGGEVWGHLDTNLRRLQDPFFCNFHLSGLKKTPWLALQSQRVRTS